MAEKVMRKHMEERFGKVFNYSMTPPLPGSLNIELNNTCNQKCVFCPFHGENAIKQLKPSKLDEGFVRRILDQAAAIGIGKKEVGFYLAGEAFLYKELPGIIAYAKGLGFSYTFITSNGALATPDKMKAVVDAGLDSIRFSVNAAERERYKEIHKTDDFDAVISNLMFLQTYKEESGSKIATSISCVITKKNYDDRYKMYEFFKPLADDVVFLPVEIERLKNRDKLVRELAIYEDRKTPLPGFVCPMLFDTMYINSDGMVVPCCHAYDFDCVFADLNENLDLEAAWNNEIYKRYRSIFVENQSDEGTICTHCILRNNGLKGMLMD